MGGGYDRRRAAPAHVARAASDGLREPLGSDALGALVARESPVISLRFVSTWAPEFVACIRRHYTNSAGAPPGKKLAVEITEDGRVIGFAGYGEPTFKLAARRRLGLSSGRPLPHTVNNFILRLEGERRAKTSEIIGVVEEAVAAEWRRRWGWCPEHWETMVGQGDAQNPGACFKRAGYRRLGLTTGRTARRPAGSTHGPRVWSDSAPKIVLYRGPLARLSTLAVIAEEQ